MILFFVCYITSILGFIIYQLIAKKKSLRQTERELGPANHKRKNGTITSSGVVFVTVTSLFFIIENGINLDTVFLILPFICYFLIGFIDDIIIILHKNNDGLSPKLRLIIEIVFSLIFYGVTYLLKIESFIDFFGYKLDLGYFYILFIVFLYVASVNTFNITDGLDGLLVSLTICILLALFVVAYKKEERIVMNLIILLIASLSSFYFFNFPNAYIFMGDAGSLSLGAICVSISIYLKAEVIFIILAIPLIFETLSVILQVIYFKLTKGKRLFKMAPFHHHLEILGYSERMITTIFTMLEIILILFVLYVFKYI